MIKAKNWQQLGDDLRTGKPVFINDAFRLFRKAGNERIRSLTTNQRYSDYQTAESLCAFLLGPYGYLHKHRFPLLDNWDAIHGSAPIPVALPDTPGVVTWDYKVPPSPRRAISREYLLQVFENYNKLRHFPIGDLVMEKVHYGEITIAKNRISPLELYRQCSAAAQIKTIAGAQPFTGCTFNYFHDSASGSTTGIFSRSIVKFIRAEALPDNGFLPETFAAAVTLSAPSSSGTVYYSPPAGTLYRQGTVIEISPDSLNRSSTMAGRETITGEYTSPFFNEEIFAELPETDNFRIGYSSYGKVIKQRNEFSNYNRYLS